MLYSAHDLKSAMSGKALNYWNIPGMAFFLLRLRRDWRSSSGTADAANLCIHPARRRSLAILEIGT
jgi:hypothetical protein